MTTYIHIPWVVVCTFFCLVFLLLICRFELSISIAFQHPFIFYGIGEGVWGVVVSFFGTRV